MEVDSLEQLPFEEAVDLLDAGEAPICFCLAESHGMLTGRLVLAFDDASGLALADLLLEQPSGTSSEWTEMSQSAALETANILGCSCMNKLATLLAPAEGPVELLPTPPKFARDFSASLMEFAIMDQAAVSDQVLLARTRFEVDGTPLAWTLLLVPDAASMSRLPELLTGVTPSNGGN